MKSIKDLLLFVFAINLLVILLTLLFPSNAVLVFTEVANPLKEKAPSDYTTDEKIGEIHDKLSNYMYEFRISISCVSKHKFLESKMKAYRCTYESKAIDDVPNKSQLSGMKLDIQDETSGNIFVVKWTKVGENRVIYDNKSGITARTYPGNRSQARYKGEFNLTAPDERGRYKLSISLAPELLDSSFHPKKSKVIRVYTPNSVHTLSYLTLLSAEVGAAIGLLGIILTQ